MKPAMRSTSAAAINMSAAGVHATQLTAVQVGSLAAAQSKSPAPSRIAPYVLQTGSLALRASVGGGAEEWSPQWVVLVREPAEAPSAVLHHPSCSGGTGMGSGIVWILCFAGGRARQKDAPATTVGAVPASTERA